MRDTPKLKPDPARLLEAADNYARFVGKTGQRDDNPILEAIALLAADHKADSVRLAKSVQRLEKKIDALKASLPEHPAK